MKKIALILSIFSLWASPRLFAHADELALIMQALENDPENITLLIQKVQTLVDMELYDEAEETLKFIEELQAAISPESTYLHILVYYSKKEKEKAYELSDWAIKEYPDSYIIWDMRGLMFTEDENVTEAIDAYSKGLSLNDEASTGFYLRLASLMLERDAEGDPQKALEVIQRGVAKLGPGSGLLQFRIRLNRDLKNYEAALGDIDILEEKFGFQMNFTTTRAKILVMAGRNDEAIETYERAIAQIDADPANSKKKYMQRSKIRLEEAKAKLQPHLAEKK